jgi:hypothetical protein
MYKALANLHQRKESVYERYQDVFETSMRQDVLENPKLMSERERERLINMEKELDQLTTAQARMEMNVFVLRDLPGGPLSIRYVVQDKSRPICLNAKIDSAYLSVWTTLSFVEYLEPFHRAKCGSDTSGFVAWRSCP